MSDLPRDPTPDEFSEHLHSYFTFERLVLFAVLHIALTLACVALAFIGHVPVAALVFGLGGALLLLGAFALSGDWSRPS
jgi:hypothetical protein